MENKSNISEIDINSLLNMSYNSEENTTESVDDIEIDLKLLETNIDELLRESIIEQEDLLEDFENFVVANNNVMLFENYTQNTLSK